MGYLLSGAGVWINFATGWEVRGSMFLYKEFNYIGSVAVALGYLALIILLTKQERMKPVWQPLSFAGRMAFSNYILMTLLATFLFYGHGLALFGRAERAMQLTWLVVIWLVVLVFSASWLKKFRFGPLEWLWRALSYRRRP
jgi:uncharacterized protein